MGFAGMISRDFIDKGIGDGMSYGWSPISPRINYSQKEKSIAKDLGISKITEVSNIENIVFFQKPRDEKIRKGKTQLIFKWRYVTEHRLNVLLRMNRELICQGAKISLQASISEIERAHENVLNILNEETDVVYFPSEKDHSDDDYEQIFAGELLGRLLTYFKNVTDDTNARNIVHDLKYLASVIMQKRNADGDYCCSIMEYVDFLKELELNYVRQECDDCCIETVFTDYKYCMVCGRRL